MNRWTIRNLAVFFFLFTISATGSNADGQTKGKHKLSIFYGSNIMATTDVYVFSVGGSDQITIKKGSPSATFARQFSSGESYTVTQLSGPRTCNLFGQEKGTFGSSDISLSANCGTGPLTLLKADFIGIEQGDAFTFADNQGRSATLRFSTLLNIGGFPTGDVFVYDQTAGPRTCRMQKPATVPAAPATITVDCRKQPGGTTPPQTQPPTQPPPATQRFASPDLVSRSTDDKSFGTFYDAMQPSVGGMGEDEGRYVAFVSYAAGLGGSTGKFRQIFWRDRKTGETRMVSASAVGGEGNQMSGAPAISADGRSVAFESYATNLVPIDTNGVRDIFVWNADRNTITAVSTGQGETETNAESYEPTISADGSLVAFTSNASNLIPNIQGQSSNNVYLKDVRSGSIQIISLDEKTKKGGGGSNPSISEDGTRIAFYNYAPLIPSDTNNLWDIYVWQRGNPKLKRVSTTSAGGERNQGDDSTSRVVAPSISGDGRYVAYATTATNVVGSDTNKVQDVFVAEVDSGRVMRASIGALDKEGDGDSPIGQGEKIAISYDGGFVAFSTKATNLGGNIIVRHINAGESVAVSKDTGLTVGQPVMSRTGLYVVFGTSKRLDGRFQSSGIFAVSTK